MDPVLDIFLIFRREPKPALRVFGMETEDGDEHAGRMGVNDDLGQLYPEEQGAARAVDLLGQHQQLVEQEGDDGEAGGSLGGVGRAGDAGEEVGAGLLVGLEEGDCGARWYMGESEGGDEEELVGPLEEVGGMEKVDGLDLVGREGEGELEQGAAVARELLVGAEQFLEGLQPLDGHPDLVDDVGVLAGMVPGGLEGEDLPGHVVAHQCCTFCEAFRESDGERNGCEGLRNSGVEA